MEILGVHSCIFVLLFLVTTLLNMCFRHLGMQENERRIKTNKKKGSLPAFPRIHDSSKTKEKSKQSVKNHFVKPFNHIDGE
ncbi:hypothetical protein GGI42DRAFT_165414 [Trichoderma sp. SZMC 28013]